MLIKNLLKIYNKNKNQTIFTTKAKKVSKVLINIVKKKIIQIYQITIMRLKIIKNNKKIVILLQRLN